MLSSWLHGLAEGGKSAMVQSITEHVDDIIDLVQVSSLLYEWSKQLLAGSQLPIQCRSRASL
jgi:hypothetical protein